MKYKEFIINLQNSVVLVWGGGEGGGGKEGYDTLGPIFRHFCPL